MSDKYVSCDKVLACARQPADSKYPYRLKNVGSFVSLTNELNDVGFASLKTLAETLVSWQAEIGRMWRINRSNGITEGFHNKMEVISRRAYGYRNFNNYRKRVLATSGWDGILATRRRQSFDKLQV